MSNSSAPRATFDHRGDRTAPDLRLIVSPVGADTDLRAALENLKLGHYHAARELLSHTGANWSLRTNRSRLLAAGVDGGIFKIWLDEEPDNADAAMMWARALTRAALTAHHAGKSRELVWRATNMARHACLRATTLEPRCPVPWISLLHLTQLPFPPHDFDPGALSRPAPWDQLGDPTMPHRGPWPILDEINRRHPGSREGYHRMREYFVHHGERGTSLDYACWITTTQQVNPELLMLPLYSLVDAYMAQHGDGRGGALQFWQSDRVRHYARQARDSWFALVPPVERRWLPLTDLSYLSYVLVASGEDARPVFEAMGPYAVSQPWQDVNTSLGRTYDWTAEFLRTRSYVLG